LARARFWVTGGGKLFGFNKEICIPHKGLYSCIKRSSIYYQGGDISMVRRVPAGWKRPLGRPRTTWLDQLRQDTGKPVATLWTRAQDRQLYARDATALKGYAG